MRKTKLMVLGTVLMLALSACGKSDDVDLDSGADTVMEEDEQANEKEQADGEEQTEEAKKPEQGLESENGWGVDVIVLDYLEATGEPCTADINFFGKDTASLTDIHVIEDLGLEVTGASFAWEVDEEGQPKASWGEGVEAASLDETLAIEHLIFTPEYSDWGLYEQATLYTEGEPTDEAKNINTIGMVNFSNEPMTIRQCYDKGWWYFRMNGKALGLKTDTGSNDGKGILEELYKEWGQPTYILDTPEEMTREDDKERLEEYILGYEIESGVIAIKIYENNYNPAYAEGLEAVCFYPKSAWEEEMKYMTAKLEEVKAEDRNRNYSRYWEE